MTDTDDKTPRNFNMIPNPVHFMKAMEVFGPSALGEALGYTPTALRQLANKTLENPKVPVVRRVIEGFCELLLKDHSENSKSKTVYILTLADNSPAQLAISSVCKELGVKLQKVA